MRRLLAVLLMVLLFPACSGNDSLGSGEPLPSTPVNLRLEVNAAVAARAFSARGAVGQVLVEVAVPGSQDGNSLSGHALAGRALAPVGDSDVVTVELAVAPGDYEIYVFGLDDSGLVVARATPFALTLTASTVVTQAVTLVSTRQGSLSLTPSSAVLTTGESLQFSALAVLPDGTTSSEVAWSSSDSAVFTVSAQGLVTGVSPGQAELSASTAGGLTATAPITVNPPAVTVTQVLLQIAPGPTVSLGQTVTFTTTALFSDGNSQDVSGVASLSSSDPAVLAVSNAGSGTALKTGTAEVTATFEGVTSTPLAVTVTNLQVVGLEDVGASSRLVSFSFDEAAATFTDLSSTAIGGSPGGPLTSEPSNRFVFVSLVGNQVAPFRLDDQGLFSALGVVNVLGAPFPIAALGPNLYVYTLTSNLQTFTFDGLQFASTDTRAAGNPEDVAVNASFSALYTCATPPGFPTVEGLALDAAGLPAGPVPGSPVFLPDVNIAPRVMGIDPAGPFVVVATDSPFFSNFLGVVELHADGSLGSLLQVVPFAGLARMGVVITPSGLIYVGSNQSGAGTLECYRLDAAGQVSFVGSTALGELPSDDLEMSPSGHFLFYPSRVTSTLVARPINSDGSLGAPVSSSTVNQANGVEVLP